MPGIRFEWDDAKNLANQRKHGVSFEQAIRIFSDPLRVTLVERIVDGEVRWQTFGAIDGIILLMVAHTLDDVDADTELVRVISARRATRQERKRYEHGQD